MSWESARLRFGDRSLSCLYLVVDDDGGFLDTWHDCGDVVAFEWSAEARPPTARVGLELRHDCGDSRTLSFALEVVRHGEALETLAATEALVVADRPWGRGGRVAAYSVDAEAVRAAVAAATSGLRRLVSSAS